MNKGTWVEKMVDPQVSRKIEFGLGKDQQNEAHQTHSNDDARKDK